MNDIQRQIFKTYDVRGVYPSQLDEKTAFTIGMTCAESFKGGVFVLARDTRLSSDPLLKSFLKGFNKYSKDNKKNFKVKIVGLSTTPMFYFLVNHLKAVGGAMTTASHNPKEYGGFKIVGKGAKPIGGKEILKLIENSK